MEKAQLKISIVTVCYNACKDLEKTMLSIFNQTYTNIEYIVIDGGSKDDTIDIISKYENNIAYWCSEPDKGIYDAMNKSLKIATGDFLLFMNAKDIFYSDKVVEMFANSMNNSKAIYYGSVIFNGIGTKHWGRFNKVKWAITNICHQAIFYPKSVYSTHSYDIKYKIYADYAYNLKLLSERIKFNYLDEIVTIYDMGGISAHHSDKEFDKNQFYLTTNAVGLTPYIIGNIWRNLYLLKERFTNSYDTNK